MKKVLSIGLVFAILLLCAACAPLEWDTFILGDAIPALDARGEVNINTEDTLMIEVPTATEKDYNAYLQACKDRGYTIDAETLGGTYYAFNEQGYKLSVSYFESNGMQITLYAPIELGELKWPTNGPAASFPKPNSTLGKVEWERENGFLIYVGKMTIEDYGDYINACSDAGYNIDYEKGNKYYRADNSDGLSLSLTYEGFNVVCIRVDEYKDSEDNDSETNNEKPADSDTVSPNATDWKETFSQNGFTQAEIDSYEGMLNKVGITDFHDVDIVENGRMHIVTGKIFDSDSLQLNMTLEDRKIIVITVAGLPDTDTEAYINWRGKLKFRTVNSKRSVDLYYDAEGGYLAVFDWENKTITAV